MLKVTAGGQAEQQGLRPGDRVVAIQGEALEVGKKNFQDVLKEKPGEKKLG